MPRLHSFAISTSAVFAGAGRLYSGGQRPLTLAATSCFGSWLTDCRPSVGATSMPKPDACLIVQKFPEQAGRNAITLRRTNTRLRPGTVLGREWNGRMHRVAVLTDAFSWNGNSYSSLSQVAFAITGTRWNGPRFFGLRDKLAKGLPA